MSFKPIPVERKVKVIYRVVIGDDAGYHSGSLFSPQFYKEIVIPVYEMIVHELSVPVILHSDGYIIPLLSMPRDAGIKAIHPLEVTANIDLKEVKEEFGQDLVLIGNADCSYILCQTDKQLIHKEVVEVDMYFVLAIVCMQVCQ